jgi:hypothetical protein
MVCIKHKISKNISSTSYYILTTLNVACAQNLKNYEDLNMKGMSSNKQISTDYHKITMDSMLAKYSP